MDDKEVTGRITELVDEEHELRNRAAEHGGLSDAERERMRRLEEQLDQCWDLLRQRRAREDAGEDPDEAAVRPVSEVESYRQ